MRVFVNHEQQIAWVKNGDTALASFAFEEFGGHEAATVAAFKFIQTDPADEIIAKLAEWADHHAADAQEWSDDDTVTIQISIGDLRTAKQLI